MMITSAFLILAVAASSSVSSLSTPERPRLIVLTDIGSLTAGVAEPDDGQSLIRLMLYTNELDIEGLIAASNLGHGQKTCPALIRQVVDAYEKVQPNLQLHDRRYPPALALSKTIKAGQPIAGTRTQISDSIGEGKDTEASEWIIRVVDRSDPRPVWALIWGGSADLAQALAKIRRTRTAHELERFLSKLRVHSIGNQDSTGPWIKEQFPDLFMITNQRAMRGMYRGGERSLVSPDWVDTHIHGHGPLGDLYPNYNGGDIWSGTMGPVQGIKEGDSPSFLSVIPNGLSDPEHPWLGSWGGRFEGNRNRFVDVPDTDLPNGTDPDPRMSSVYRWRPAFQADFQARLDWCIKPFSQANHPPEVRIEGERERKAGAGDVMTLDASGSTDPDGNDLTFQWSIYPTDHDVAAKVAIEGRNRTIARVAVAHELAGKTISILLSVSDRGSPTLTRYGRVLITPDQTVTSSFLGRGTNVISTSSRYTITLWPAEIDRSPGVAFSTTMAMPIPISISLAPSS